MLNGIEQLVINIEHDIDEQYQYSPGEVIQGQTLVYTCRALRLSSIKIQVKGEGVVSWEDENTGKQYQANEIYINASHILPESVDYQLVKGMNEFDFQYQLPDNVPSSYIGKFGSVTYVIKVTVTGERRTDSFITSEPFLVLRSTALPRKTVQPRQMIANRRYWGMCGFGKVCVDAMVHHTGVLPGEDFFVNAEIKNKSPRQVVAIQAALLMDTRYHAKNTINFYRQLINRRRDEVDLRSNEGRRWQNVHLAVPPYIPESKLDGCDIIDIDYVFQLLVEVSGNKYITLEIPVVIASQYSTDKEVERVSHYDLRSTDELWSDQPIKPHLISNHSKADGHFYETDNYRTNDQRQFHWTGHTLPELRKDTNVENPLFDNNDMISPRNLATLDAKEEVIESTKL